MRPNPAIVDRVDDLIATFERRHGAAAIARVVHVWESIKSDANSRDASGNPLQRPTTYLFPGLRAKPWWTGAPEIASAVTVLEANADQIRDEALAALDHFSVYLNYDKSVRGEGGVWSSLIVREMNRTVAEVGKVVPRTAEVLGAVPGLRDVGMFSAVNPGCHIVPHCGPWNTRVTLHLGLVVPDECAFRVGSETRVWTEGKCLAFDDSFEHEVWNRSGRSRLVLLVDIWHPDLTPLETELIPLVIDEGLSANSTEPAPAPHGTPWWIG